MKIVKGGVFISLIYILAIICTLLITNRVQELDSKTDLRNNNSSLSIHLAR